jgi:hypothetical protein
MSVPTQGEEFAKFIEYITKAQESAYTLGHLSKSMSSNRKDQAIGDGWIAIGELMKRVNYQVTMLAQGKLQ